MYDAWVKCYVVFGRFIARLLIGGFKVSLCEDSEFNRSLGFGCASARDDIRVLFGGLGTY